MTWFLIGLLVLVVIFVLMAVKVVQQQRVGVLERLGKFHRLLHPGLNVVIPFIEYVRIYHDLRIQQTSVPPSQ